MCKVTQEAVIRANNRTINGSTVKNSPAVKDKLVVSVRYQGKVFTKQYTIKEVNSSFAKIMKGHGQNL